MVRETALDALAKRAPDLATAEAKKLIEDESKIVQDLAKATLQTKTA